LKHSDEILYNAKLHPEQYSDTFSSAQLKQLHKSILYVCNTAVECLADSSKFPEEWLFKHRWGKGKKDSPTTLPNGAKITFLTVGGRTSCVVPSIQKKTGAVAGDVKKEAAETGEDPLVSKRGAKGPTTGKDVLKVEGPEGEDENEPSPEKEIMSKGAKKRKAIPKAGSEVENGMSGIAKKRKAVDESKKATSKTSKQNFKVEEEVEEEPDRVRRRSGRSSNAKV